MNALQTYFDENLYELDKEDIERLCKMNNDPIINNVIVGRRTHCYGLMLIDDQKSIDYQLFYINGKRDLRGFLLKMTLHHPERHAILLQFCQYLTESFDLDIFAVYNTFQEKTCSMAEQLGFYTIDPIELQKFTEDPNPAIAVKGTRGVIFTPMLKQLDYYEYIFGPIQSITPSIGVNFIYLMFNSKTNLVKIGKSKNPAFREKTLQSEEPEISLIAVWQASHQTETELHRQYKDKRVRGEWFKLALKDMTSIKDYMDATTKAYNRNDLIEPDKA